MVVLESVGRKIREEEGIPLYFDEKNEKYDEKEALVDSLLQLGQPKRRRDDGMGEKSDTVNP